MTKEEMRRRIRCGFILNCSSVLHVYLPAAGCPFLLCIEDSDSIVKLIYKKIRGKEERNCCLGGGRWWSRIPLKCRSSTLDMVCWDEDDLRSSVIYKDEVMFSISKDV